MAQCSPRERLRRAPGDTGVHLPLSQVGLSRFCHITIDYVPDRHVVELKTLKLYINKYRNRQISHESAANTILDDLISLLSPRWMRVVADFTVRGNIKTIIFAEHTAPEYQGPHPEYRRYLTV